MIWAKFFMNALTFIKQNNFPSYSFSTIGVYNTPLLPTYHQMEDP